MQNNIEDFRKEDESIDWQWDIASYFRFASIFFPKRIAFSKWKSSNADESKFYDNHENKGANTYKIDTILLTRQATTTKMIVFYSNSKPKDTKKMKKKQNT